MMIDAQPPAIHQRAADASRLGAMPVRAPDSIPAIVQGRPRIHYHYWAGAIVAGVALWAGIFYLAF